MRRKGLKRCRNFEARASTVDDGIDAAWPAEVMSDTLWVDRYVRCTFVWDHLSRIILAIEFSLDKLKE